MTAAIADLGPAPKLDEADEESIRAVIQSLQGLVGDVPPSPKSEEPVEASDDPVSEVEIKADEGKRIQSL